MASQIEGGVGGLIDIRTHKPFDFNGFEATASIGASNANQAARTKPRFSGLVSNVWHTRAGKFGALVGVSFEQRAVNQISFTSNSVDYYTGPVGDGSTVTASDPLLYNAGGEVEDTSPETRTREGLNTSFEWQPNNRWLLQLNTYSAYFKAAEHGYEVRFDDSLPGKFSALVPDLVHGQSSLVQFTKWPGTDILKDGTFDNVFSNAATFYDNSHDRLNQIAFNAAWKATQRLTLNGEVSTTRSIHTEREGKLELFGFVPQMNVNMATIQPSLVPVNFSLASKSSWFWNDIEDDRFHNNGAERAFKFDGQYDTGNPLFPTVDFGYRYDNRQAGNFENQIFEGPNASNYENGGAIVPGTLFGYNVADVNSGPSSIAAASVLTPQSTRFGSVLLPRDDIFTDINSFYKLMGISSPIPPLDDYTAADTFGADERTDALYALGFLSTGGVVPVDANFGVRYVRTKDTLEGLVRPANTALVQHNTYYDLLPSLNLTAHLTSDLQLRFAANKTMSRPSFTDLSPTVVLDGASHTGKGGNPDLKPFKATGYDLALEWFPTKGADLFGDVFYKHIRNSITNVASISFEPNGVDSGLYLIDRPTANKEGMFRGVEAGYQQFFTMAPGLLKYTGVNLSYTYVHSSVTGAVPGFVTPLTDLSRDSYNAILMFDIPHTFWARLAYNWRSGFFEGFETGAVGPGGPQSLPEFMHPFGIVDASAGYWITHRLQLSMDAVNIAHSVQRSYIFNPLLAYQILMEDKRVTLNLSYTF